MSRLSHGAASFLPFLLNCTAGLWYFIFKTPFKPLGFGTCMQLICGARMCELAENISLCVFRSGEEEQQITSVQHWKSNAISVFANKNPKG